MTSPYSETDIERIAKGVLERTHPYAEWTHAAHFAAALWLLRHPDVLVQHGGMGPIIRGYNEAVGVPNTQTRGYHATITIASLRATASFLAEAGPDAELAPILDNVLASPLGDSRWLEPYWTEARLMSRVARREWVEPDRLPLPYPPLAAELLADRAIPE
ncbi:MAG: hypothetical protein J7493_01365 [Porphyrobacter sp.]|nr:hypothetical protein [Porphyrobacter sp.]